MSIIKKITIVKVCRDGVWFLYRGDEVLYTWAWRRKSGYKFISLGCEGGFNRLKDIDRFWLEFNMDRLLTTPGGFQKVIQELEKVFFIGKHDKNNC